MKTVIALWFLLLMYPALFAQHAGASKTSYDVSYPNRRYGVKAASIHDVDFKNLKVFWHDEAVKLHNGSYRQTHKLGYDEVHLGPLEFLASAEGLVDHAIIDLEWHNCRIDCMVSGRVQVFELKSGHLTMVQEIECDRRASGTGIRFDRQNQVLTITGRTNDHTLGCCPEHLDVMHFGWDGKSFAFKDATTKALSDQ